MAANLERESRLRPLRSSSPSRPNNCNNNTPKSSSDDKIFAALPTLSIAADAALCRFRSSMTKPALGQEQTVLLLKARETNEDYAIALEGVISSLASISQKIINSGGCSNRCKFIINEKTVETAMAVLMTAVSGVWCYLHGAESEVTLNRIKSRRIVERGVQLSSCCFLGINPKLLLPTYEESLEVMDNVLQKMNRQSPQKESHVERLEYVFRNIKHASRIIGLTSKKESLNYKLEGQEVVSKKMRKRSKRDDINVTNKRSKTHESDRLEVQKNIVVRLKKYIDTQHRVDKSQVSSDCLKKPLDSMSQRALQIQEDELPGQLQCLLHGLDILSGNMNEIDNRAAIFSSLESQSSVSKYAAFILACIHMKHGDFKKAMQYYTTVLKLNRAPNRCGDMEKDTLSNIALCFAVSGKLVPCLEILLHRLDLGESESASSTILPLRAELLPQMQNHNTSDTGRHLCVIWQVFFVGSLLGDWGTCRNVLKELKKMSICNDYISLANTFVDLESKDVAKERTQSKPVFLPTPTARFAEKAFLIYSAELLAFSNEDDKCVSADETIFTRIHSMTSKLLALSPSPADRSQSESRHIVLQATILNNHGFALVLKGESVQASSFFLEATKLYDHDQRGCSLPVHNLSFLLWQQGHKLEASKLYLKSKGYGHELSELLQSDIQSFELEKAKASLLAYRDRLDSSVGTREVDDNSLGKCLIDHILQEYC